MSILQFYLLQNDRDIRYSQHFKAGRGRDVPMKRQVAVLLLMSVLVLASLTIHPAFADPIKNSFRQRIGNYQMEMATDPLRPLVGQPVKIMLRVATIDGQDLVDTPILIRILKDNNEVTRTNPILIPYGHYTYQYTFTSEATYAIDIDLNDTLGNGDTITFEFPVKVALYDYTLLSYVGLVVTGAGFAVALLVYNKRKVQKRAVSDAGKK